jgi:hypothetical protein
VGHLQDAGPASKERSARKPIGTGVDCAEGMIESKAPVCQVGEVRERVLGRGRGTVTSVPAKDGKEGDKSIATQQGSQGKECARRNDPRSLETERWIEASGFTCGRRRRALPKRHVGGSGVASQPDARGPSAGCLRPYAGRTTKNVDPVDAAKNRNVGERRSVQPGPLVESENICDRGCSCRWAEGVGDCVEGAMLLSTLALVMVTRHQKRHRNHIAHDACTVLVYARTVTGMSPETSKADRRVFIHAFRGVSSLPARYIPLDGPYGSAIVYISTMIAQ